MNQANNRATIESRLAWLYKISGAAALLVGILFLIALISLIITVLLPGTTNGWIMPLQNNWLIVIFKLFAGIGRDQIRLLYIVNLLDITIMALVGTMYVGTMYLGLSAILTRKSLIWLIIAATQTFTGIFVFIATKSTGRTGVMGAVFIVSLVMLRSNHLEKEVAFMGILASLLLGLGDFSVGLIPPLIPPIYIIAAFLGIGYILFMIWFFLIANRLFQLKTGVLKELV